MHRSRRQPHAPSLAHFLFEPLEQRTLLSWTYFSQPLYGPEPARASGANSVFADFDGDGVADRATADGTLLSFAKGHADGSFDADRTTNVLAPVGHITAGRFDGSGRSSLIGIGTSGGAVDGRRPNEGFRLRAFTFDPATLAASGDQTPGSFVQTTVLGVPDFNRLAPLPTAVASDLFSGWRDEFVIQLTRPDNSSAIAVFSFKNSSTIVRAPDALVSANATGGLSLGDILASGKQQIVFNQAHDQTSEIRYISLFPSGQSRSNLLIRVFPSQFTSFSLGDMDSDGRTDIVALPRRILSVNGSIPNDSRLWLIRSLGSGSFAAPRALTPHLTDDRWYNEPESYQHGAPSIAGIADLNGDGRLDILIITYAFWEPYRDYRLTKTSPTIALQLPGGQFDLTPLPIAIGLSGSARIVAAPDPAARPSILVDGIHLIHAVEQQQPPQLLDFTAYRVFAGSANPTNIAKFSAFAFDPDILRGGSIARVDFYIDLNGDGLVDAQDLFAGTSTTPGIDRRYSLLAPIQPAWETSPGYSRVLAVAYDSTGLASSPRAFNLYLR